MDDVEIIEIVSVERTEVVEVYGLNLNEALVWHNALKAAFPDDHIGLRLTFTPDCIVTLWTSMRTGITHLVTHSEVLD